MSGDCSRRAARARCCADALLRLRAALLGYRGCAFCSVAAPARPLWPRSPLPLLPWPLAPALPRLRLCVARLTPAPLQLLRLPITAPFENRARLSTVPFETRATPHRIPRNAPALRTHRHFPPSCDPRRNPHRTPRRALRARPACPPSGRERAPATRARPLTSPGRPINAQHGRQLRLRARYRLAHAPDWPDGTGGRGGHGLHSASRWRRWRGRPGRRRRRARQRGQARAFERAGGVRGGARREPALGWADAAARARAACRSRQRWTRRARGRARRVRRRWQRRAHGRAGLVAGARRQRWLWA